MTKGDIVLVPFPFTDLSGQKVRPVLVLHTEMKSEDRIVALFSSIKPKKTYFFDLHVTPSKHNGLKVSSIVKINKIATLEKKLIIGQLGKLEVSHIKEVNKKLRRLMGL